MQEEEKGHIGYLKSVEEAYSSKRVRFEDGLAAIDANTRLIAYLKENGMMDEGGNIIKT
jgi:hypothetical protein